MNEYDSERVAGLLQEQHFKPAESLESADIILLNTCSVRQKAADKIYSELGRLKKIKARNPRLLIGVGGCLAQHESEKLLKQFPIIDVLYGTQALASLPALLSAAAEGNRAVDVCLDALAVPLDRDHARPQTAGGLGHEGVGEPLICE